ncbi:MAG: phage tail protein [Actinomycetota bacterium]
MTDHAPVASFRFRVEVVERGPRGGGGRSVEVDVSEVRLPPFRRRPDLQSEPTDTSTAPGLAGTSPNLILRRGHTGTTEFYDWWGEEPDSKRRTRRDVMVTLLNEDGKPVTRWSFDDCRLETFEYSPLDALDSAVLMETAEISFERATQERRSR